MKILSIETSCDETAISIVEAFGGLDSPSFSVLGNSLFSQIEIHKEYGGVYPMLAKREHSKNLPILLEKTLKEAKMHMEEKLDFYKWDEIKEILKREEGLFENFKKITENLKKPEIDLIAVTSGPGLEPALWVGISFAEALGKLWNIPTIPANHMEGHITSVLINDGENKIQFPALAVLISGGHTEIVEINTWGQYKILGQTLDDAVGEAFDKVARLLDLPYPGGPEISKIAEDAREKNIKREVKLPRPMINSKDLNFSFSGLKTSVLYYIRDNFNGESKNMSYEQKADLAREFEDSVIEILINKTTKVLEEKNIKTLIIAGGVIANKKIREAFNKLKEKYTDLEIKIPTKELSTDNSIMIATASYIKYLLFPEIVKDNKKIIAEGNLKLK